MDVNLLTKNFFICHDNKYASKPLQKNNENDTKYKLKRKNNQVTNEIQISVELNKIPCHLTKYESIIDVRSLTNSNKVPDLFNEDPNNYLLIKYNSISSCSSSSSSSSPTPLPSPNVLYLKDYLQEEKHKWNVRVIISRSLESYKSILTSLLELSNNGITFFDLTPYDNIIFVGDKPILRRFENSILHKQIQKQIHKQISDAYMVNLIKNITSFTHKPLEVHLLFYLIINNKKTLDVELSEVVVNHFMENMTTLTLFSQGIQTKYRAECKEFVGSYVGKETSYIVNDVIKYYYTWDNYAVSVIYLHIFGTMLRTLSLSKTFIHDVVSLLYNNVSAFPDKRKTIKNTIDIYYRLFYKYDNWGFVDDISEESIMKLHDAL